MNFLTEFLHQEVPKSGKEMPEYYRKALFFSELILAAFFLLSSALLLGYLSSSLSCQYC